MSRRLFATGHIDPAGGRVTAGGAPPSLTGFVRVRIAVAIRGGTHEWAACGGSETEDGQARREVVDCFDPRDPVSVVWVEADVTVPSEVTVEGRVSLVPEIMAEDLEIVTGGLEKRRPGQRDG